MATDGEVEEGAGGPKPKNPADEGSREPTGGGERGGLPGKTVAAAAAASASSRSSPSASDPADWTSALLSGDGDNNNNNNGASPSPNSPRPGQGQQQQRPTAAAPIPRPPTAAPLIPLPHQRAATAVGVPPGSATGTTVTAAAPMVGPSSVVPIGAAAGAGAAQPHPAVQVTWPRPSVAGPMGTTGPGMVGLGPGGVPGGPPPLTAPTPMQAAQLPRQPQSILMTTSTAAAAGTRVQPPSQGGAQPPMQIQQQQMQQQQMQQQQQQQPTLSMTLQQQMQPPPARKQQPQVPPAVSTTSSSTAPRQRGDSSSASANVTTPGAGDSAAVKAKTAGAVATSKPAAAPTAAAASPQRQQQPQQQQQQPQQQQQQPQQQHTSSSSTSPPDPSAPVMVPGFSHPLPHLHHLFHPYVLPTDASLDAARLRLRTALDQTRLLRETFTHRVWDKYNIVLRPVETSVDEIVIRNTPENPLGGGLEGAKERIRREAGVWSWEKRIEGIARDEMGNVVPPTPPPGSPVPSGSANPAPGSGGGGGGFSLVVLPDDPTYAELEGRNRERCGKKISGASAAAASVLISRARSNAAARRVVFADLAREQAQARAAQAAAAAATARAEVKASAPAVASASADATTAPDGTTTTTSSSAAATSSPQQQQSQQPAQQQQQPQKPKSKYPPSGPIVVHVGPDELRAAALPPALASSYSSPAAAASASPSAVASASSPSGSAGPTTPGAAASATTPSSSSAPPHPGLAPCTSHDALDAVRSAAGDVAGGATTPGPASSSSGSRSGRGSGSSANLPKTVVVAPGAAAAAAAAAALQRQQPRLRVVAPVGGGGGAATATAAARPHHPSPSSPSSSSRKKSGSSSSAAASRGSPRPGGQPSSALASGASVATTTTPSSAQPPRPGPSPSRSPSAAAADATAAAASALAVAFSPAAMFTTRLTPAEIAALPHHPFPDDVTRDDKLILHHRSSGAYRGKVLRNASRSPVASRILGSGGGAVAGVCGPPAGGGAGTTPGVVSVPPLVRAWTAPRPPPPPPVSSGSPPPLTGEEADASSPPDDKDEDADEPPYRAARMALRCAYASRHVVPLLSMEDGGDGGGRRPPQSRPPPGARRRDHPRDGVSLPPPWRWMGDARHIRVVEGGGGGARTGGETTAAASASYGTEEARLALGRVLDAFYGPAATRRTKEEGPEEEEGSEETGGRRGVRGEERKEEATASGDGGDDDGGDGGRPRKRKRPRPSAAGPGILLRRQDATVEDERHKFRRQDATLEDERLRYRRQDAFSLSPEPPPEEEGRNGDGDDRGDKDGVAEAEAGKSAAAAATDVSTVGSGAEMGGDGGSGTRTTYSDEEADDGAGDGVAPGRKKLLRRQDATLEDERVKYQRQNATIQDGGSSAALSSSSENERVPMDVDVDTVVDVGRSGGTSKDLGVSVDSKPAGPVVEVGGGEGPATPATAPRRLLPRLRPIDEVDLARRLRFPRYHPPRKEEEVGVDAADEENGPPRRYDDVTVYSTLVALGLVVPRSATVRRRGRRRRKRKRGGPRGPPSRWSSNLLDPILRGAAPSSSPDGEGEDRHHHDDVDDVDVIEPWFEVGDEVEAKWHPPDPGNRGEVGYEEARFFSKTAGDDDDAADGQRSSEENQHHEPGWYPGFITRVRRSAPPSLWRVLTTERRRNDDDDDDDDKGSPEDGHAVPSNLQPSSRIYYDVEYEDGDVDVGLPESLIRKKRPHGEGSDSEDEDEGDGDGDGDVDGLRAGAAAGGVSVPPPEKTTSEGFGGPDGDGRPATAAGAHTCEKSPVVDPSMERKRDGDDAEDGDVGAADRSLSTSAPRRHDDDVAPRRQPTGPSLTEEDGSDDLDDEGIDHDDYFGVDYDRGGRQRRIAYSIGVVNEYRSRFDGDDFVGGGGVPPSSSSSSPAADPDPSSAAAAIGGGGRAAGSTAPVDTPPGDGTGEGDVTKTHTSAGTEGPGGGVGVEGEEGAAAPAPSSSSGRRRGEEVSKPGPTTGASSAASAASPATPLTATDDSADINRASGSDTAVAPPTTLGEGVMEVDATAEKKPLPPTPRSVGGDCSTDVKNASAEEEKAVAAPAPSSSGDEDPPGDDDCGASPSATVSPSAAAAARRKTTKESSEGVTTVGKTEVKTEVVNTPKTTDPSSSDAIAAAMTTTEPTNEEQSSPTAPVDVTSSPVPSPRNKEVGEGIQTGAAGTAADDETSGKKGDILDDSKQNEREKEGDAVNPSKPDMKKRSAAAKRAGSKQRLAAPQHSVDTAMMLQRGPLGMEDLIAGRPPRGTATSGGDVLPASVPSSSADGGVGGLRMPPPPLPPQRAHTTGSASLGSATAHAGVASSTSAWGGVGSSLPSSSSSWTTSSAAATGSSQTEPYLTQLAAAHSAAAAAEAAAAARYPTTGAITSQQKLDLLDAMEGRRARAAVLSAAATVSASPSRLHPHAAQLGPRAAASLYPSQNSSATASAGLSPHSLQFSAAAARAAAASASAAYDDPYASAATALYLEDLAAAQSSLAAATYEYNALVRHAQQQQQERRIREHAAAIAAAAAVNPGAAAIDPLLRSPYDAWAATAAAHSQTATAGLSPQAARQLALLHATGAGQRQRPSSANAAVHYSSTSSPYGDGAGMASALLGSMQGSTTARPRPSSASTFHQQMRQLERRYVADVNAEHQRPSTAMAAVSTGDMMSIREHVQHHHRGGGGVSSTSVHRGLLHHGYNSPGGAGAMLPGGAGTTEVGTSMRPLPTDQVQAQAQAALAALHGRPSSAGARLSSLSSSQQKRTTRRQQQQKMKARPTSSGGRGGGGGETVAARDVADGTIGDVGGVGGGVSSDSNAGSVLTKSENVRGRRTTVGIVDSGGAAQNADGVNKTPSSAPTDEEDKTPTDKGGDVEGDSIAKDGNGNGSAASESRAPPDTPSTGMDDGVTPSSSKPCHSKVAITTDPDENPGSCELDATSTEVSCRASSDTKVASSSSADVGVANLTTGGTTEWSKSTEPEVADDDKAEKNPSSVRNASTCVPTTTKGSKIMESSTSNACTTSSSGGPSASASDKSASAGSAPEQKTSPSEDRAAAAITKPIESVVSSDGVNIGSQGARNGVDQTQPHDDGGTTAGTRLLRTFVAPPAPSELESNYPSVAGLIRRGLFPSDLRSALRRRRHHGAGSGEAGADVSRERRAAAVDVQSAPIDEELPPDANREAPSSDAISTEPTDADGAVRANASSARTKDATLSRLEEMCLDYLFKVAEAVLPLFSPPLDKTWIMDEMVQWCASRRASSPARRGRSSNVLAMKGLKEVLNAIVTIWLWRQLERCASSWSDGISNNAKFVSVDSEECTFMMKRAVDTALRAASEAVDDDDENNDKLGDCSIGTSTSKTAQVAGKVCDSLRKALCVDCYVDEALLHLPQLVRYLEAQRRIALHLMLYERALLATYLSFTLTMSDSFSNAYVASLIVAGEALGHDMVCDLVRDDVCGVCTMLPYDIVLGQNHHPNRDPSAEWEDPCRPTASYTSGLNAIELTRRAHARAQVHRSLFKLQEKHGFQGGTPNAGPYDETPAPNDPSSAPLTPTASAGGATPRGGASGLKRKSSFTGREIDATGGATHSGALQYPAHYCAPLVIQKDDVSFLPYGRHTQIRKESSPSPLPSAKRTRVSVEPVSSKEDHTTSASNAMDLVRSTEPIDWLDVAKMFQPVALPDQSAAATVSAGSQVGVSSGKSTGGEGMPKIFAPVVRQLEKRTSEPLDSWSDTEEEDDDSLEEDISDDAVLSRHQAVLDHMKEKLDVAMGQRNNRSRSFGGTAPARASASAR